MIDTFAKEVMFPLFGITVGTALSIMFIIVCVWVAKTLIEDILNK